jgi:hypothetical protein
VNPRIGRAALLAAGLLLVPAAAVASGDGTPAGGQRGGGTRQSAAQPAPVRQADRAHAFDLTLGAQWSGSSPLGVSQATMTPNQGGSTRSFVLFRSSADLEAAPGLEARLGFALNDSLAIEGGVAYSRPAVRVSLSDDFEQAPQAAFDAERLNQYVVDAALVVYLRKLAFARRRARPFVFGGGGYLRQLHEGNTLVDIGQVYYFGGGVKYLLRDRPGRRLGGIGLRVDARAMYRRKGYTFEDKGRLVPVVGGGLLLAF